MYLMWKKFDCGLSMLLDFLNRSGVKISYEALWKIWGFIRVSSFLANLRDNPGAHWRILRRFNIPWRVCTLQDIYDGNYRPDFTAVLVHLPENPALYQHWAIVHAVTTTHVVLHWGAPDPNIPNTPITKTVTREEFTAFYRDGSPACAYVIGEGSTDWCWEMTWDLLLSIVLYIPSKI